MADWFSWVNDDSLWLMLLPGSFSSLEDPWLDLDIGLAPP